MAGLFTSDELGQFHLNQKDFIYDPKSTLNIDAALEKCPPLTLTCFHRQLLRKMLAFEAEDRPHFIELEDIFRSPQLQLNMENQQFVEGIIREKIRECGNQLTMQMMLIADKQERQNRGGDNRPTSRFNQ
jgi:hypothetical protein